MSQKRYAYLIGANGPQDMRLKHAETDVIRLADALKGSFCRFASAEVVIADNRQGGLRGFKQFAEQCAPGDLLLVHFAGHAIFDEQLYLLCNDSDINDLISTALEINAIKTHLRRSRASYKVLILDCCHAAGAHPGGALRGEQDIPAITAALYRAAAQPFSQPVRAGIPHESWMHWTVVLASSPGPYVQAAPRIFMKRPPCPISMSSHLMILHTTGYPKP